MCRMALEAAGRSGEGREGLTLDLTSQVLMLAGLAEVEAVAGLVEAVEEVADGREERGEVGRVRRLDGNRSRERGSKRRSSHLVMSEETNKQQGRGRSRRLKSSISLILSLGGTDSRKGDRETSK